MNVKNNRYDSELYDNKEDALELDKMWCKKGEYNTGDGYVVTNKFDPACNDKTTPVTPCFISYQGRTE